MRMPLVATACWIACASPLAAQQAAPAGATSCSGCHDAQIANPAIPPLKGRPSAEIVTAMEEFRAGKREATVMARIGKGFTDDEMRAIANWLSQDKGVQR